jgi:predicted phage replisome organizer
MADVKWIKIITDIFDDEKMLLIEAMPSADSIIVIWFKLLTFSGKQNNDGVFLMNNKIPYTDEMLASIFRRDVNTVRMALKVFQDFGMIDIIDNVITIPNWNKHQTLDAYERKKERDRIYQADRRAKQKLLIEKSSDKSADNNTTQSSYVAISEEDKEKDIDKDINNIIISDSDEPEPAPKPKKEKPVKHKYGEYNNVLLTDEELQKLKSEYSDWGERIERLSSYVASTGKSYKSHYATIRNWARKDAEKKPQGRKELVPDWMKKSQFHNIEQREYDYDDLQSQFIQQAQKTAGNNTEVARRAEALKKELGAS